MEMSGEDLWKWSWVDLGSSVMRSVIQAGEVLAVNGLDISCLHVVVLRGKWSCQRRWVVLP